MRAFSLLYTIYQEIVTDLDDHIIEEHPLMNHETVMRIRRLL